MQPICFLAYLIACLHYLFAYLNTRGGTPCGVRAIKDVPGVCLYNICIYICFLAYLIAC